MVSHKIIYNYENKEWDKISKEEYNNMLEEEKNKVIDVGEKLTKRLEVVRDKRLRKDKDFVLIIDGDVGCGKSNLGRCIARIVSNENFHPKTHVVKTAKDIKRVFRNAKRYEAIIFDEGSLIFASTNTMTKETKYANAVLDVCRQRNLFLIIIAPKFYRLGRSVAIDRSNIFIHAYYHKLNGSRGPYMVYNSLQKEKLYNLYKKNAHFGARYKTSWKGWCHEDKTYTKEYKEMKDETYKEALDLLEQKNVKSPLQIEREYRNKLVSENPEMKATELAKILNCTDRTIQKIRKTLRESKENDTFGVITVNNN